MEGMGVNFVRLALHMELDMFVLLPVWKETNIYSGRRDSLTTFEIEDVMASHRERRNGQSRHFENVEDLFAWLDSE